MSEHYRHLHERPARQSRITRRAVLQGASAASLSAISVGLLRGRVASQNATPVSSPVPASGARFFDTDQLRSVMTFNLANADDLEAWDARKGVMLDLLRRNQPLLIGTQEGLKVQMDFLQANLENYDFIGVSRQGNEEDEYNAIFYDNSLVTVEESDTFWLSETPAEPGSMLPGEGHPRIATWGKFTIEGQATPLYMFNTHVSFNSEAGQRQVDILLEHIDNIAEPGADVLVTGDFNTPRNTYPWQVFQKKGFQDAWQLAKYEAGPDSTFHGWEGLEARGGFEQQKVADESNYRIDWILYRAGTATGVSHPLLVQVVTDHEDDEYPSDHFPVMLTTLGTPIVSADSLQVVPLEARAHDEIMASATITNTGDAGVPEITLYLDRVPVDSQWIVLDANETRDVVFPIHLYAPGEHEVSIELLPSAVITIEGAPASLAFLDIEADPYVLPEQVIAITATIENQGSFEGTAEANLFVDDVVVASSPVTVAPGEKQEAGFVHSFDEPGAYDVAIGSQTTIVNNMVELPTSWLFHRDDDPGWSDPAFDDSAWKPTELPQSWEESDDYTEDYVYGWYRLTFTVPAEWEGRPLRLILGQIDDADKSYFNGEMIGETGGFPDDPDGFLSAWNEVREYTVPADLIHYGDDNTIAVRVYDELGGGGIHNGPLGMLPLDEEPEDADQT